MESKLYQYRENSGRNFARTPVYLYRMRKKAPEHLFLPHWHPETELIRLVQGGGTVEVEGVRRYYPEGTVLAVGPDQLHACRRDPADGELIVHAFLFQPGSLVIAGQEDPILEPLSQGRIRFCPELLPGDPGHVEVQAVLCRIEALLSEPWAHWTPLLSRSLLLKLIAAYAASGGLKENASSENPGNRTVRQVVTWLQDNIASPVSLGNLAEALHLNPCYLVRLFRQHTGLTPMALLGQLRLRMAAVILETEKATVTEVAFRCGFENVSHFIRLFHRCYGCPPGKWSRLGSVPAVNRLILPALPSTSDGLP
ncbi:MAG TPA: hypothetical protein DD727_00545 [Clostridiales bacterium]|nr:hypothetical protein [Clostridiales bacterium]